MKELFLPDTREGDALKSLPPEAQAHVLQSSAVYKLAHDIDACVNAIVCVTQGRAMFQETSDFLFPLHERDPIELSSIDRIVINSWVVSNPHRFYKKDRA